MKGAFKGSPYTLNINNETIYTNTKVGDDDIGYDMTDSRLIAKVRMQMSDASLNNSTSLP